MNKALISLMFVLLFVVGSCGGDDSSDNKDDGVNCTGVDKFCNSNDGTLWWSDVSSSSMDWDEAITYCKNLGGRLPTISELRTLIQNCPGTVTGGECGVTDSCLSFGDCWNDPCGGCEYDGSGKYSVFGDTYWFWSSSELSDDAGYAWHVFFRDGFVYSYSSNALLVRCVR